jgi:hypothetical protein
MATDKTALSSKPISYYYVNYNPHKHVLSQPRGQASLPICFNRLVQSIVRFTTIDKPTLML